MAANLMDTDLDKVYTWANAWLVKFNPHKTEELKISRKTITTNHPSITMNNVKEKRVDFHKHGGFTFSNGCMWHEHVYKVRLG